VDWNKKVEDIIHFTGFEKIITEEDTAMIAKELEEQYGNFKERCMKLMIAPAYVVEYYQSVFKEQIQPQVKENTEPVDVKVKSWGL
jgi:hypothetical protein